MAVNILTIYQFHGLEEIQRYRDEPGFYQHADRAAMNAMASSLLPLVKIEEFADDLVNFRKERRYSIAVGDLRDQSAVDAAVERRAKEIADERFAKAAAAAIKNIEHWGSHLGWSEISKRDAYRIVRETFNQPS